MSCTTYCMYCILGMSSWGWDTRSVGRTSWVSYHIGYVETNFIFFLAPSETQNNKIISMSMATSPTSRPNHRNLINDTTPPTTTTTLITLRPPSAAFVWCVYRTKPAQPPTLGRRCYMPLHQLVVVLHADGPGGWGKPCRRRSSSLRSSTTARQPHISLH